MARGVLASVFASALFAALFYYATLLDSLSGAEIFGWRMLFNAPCLTVLLVLNRQRLSRPWLDATALATVAVGNELAHTGGISWVTAFSAVVYSQLSE